jgi:hypothetical protein
LAQLVSPARGVVARRHPASFGAGECHYAAQQHHTVAISPIIDRFGFSLPPAGLHDHRQFIITIVMGTSSTSSLFIYILFIFIFVNLILNIFVCMCVQVPTYQHKDVEGKWQKAWTELQQQRKNQPDAAPKARTRTHACTHTHARAKKLI